MAVIGGTAATGAAIGAAIGDGIGAVVGAAGGAILGWWMVNQAGDNGAAAFDSQAKADYASSLASVMENYLNLSHANAVNLVNTLNLTDYYFARKAEWGAKALYDYQTENGLSHAYDADWVL